MDDNSTPDDDDDWMKYANSGFGSTDYSLWDDVEEVEQPPEQADEPEQLGGAHRRNSTCTIPCRIETPASNGDMQLLFGPTWRETVVSTDKRSLGSKIRDSISEGNPRLIAIR